MAVGMLLNLPGVTQEQYEQVNEKMWGHFPMRPEDAPDGLLMHSAGASEDGWYAYDIWESPEDFQNFVDNRLMPGIEQAGGIEGEPNVTFTPAHAVFNLAEVSS